MIALTTHSFGKRSTKTQIKAPKLKVLSVNADAKTSKGSKLNYLTAILYLAPANEAKRGNLCPHASEGCKEACLFTAGRGKFSNVRQARINKTLRWFDDRRAFIADICRDIAKLKDFCKKHGFKPAVRLNGTSDIAWENVIHPDHGCSIIELFNDVQFYDYTKNPQRAIKAAKGLLPSNYSLTFSRSESNERHVTKVLRAGGNVAVVYSKNVFNTALSFQRNPILDKEIFNGDETDLRFLDPKNVIVALRAKGDANNDQSGFVIN